MLAVVGEQLANFWAFVSLPALRELRGKEAREKSFSRVRQLACGLPRPRKGKSNASLGRQVGLRLCSWVFRGRTLQFLP